MALNAKPIILWDNLLANADISASSEDPNYPVKNLADWREFLKWKTAESTESEITIDCGAPKPISALCLYEHNFYSQGQDIVLSNFVSGFMISQTQQNRWLYVGTPYYTKKVQQIIFSQSAGNGFKLTLRLKPVGSPTDNLRIALYSGSDPSEVGDPIEYHDISVSSDNYYEIDFNSALEAGSYLIFLYRTGEANNSHYYGIRSMYPGPYEQGKSWKDDFGNGNWVEMLDDFYFIVEVSSYWEEIISLVHDIDFFSDAPITAIFEEVNCRYYKLEFTNPGLSEMALLFLGNYLQFPHWPQEGFDPNAQEISIESALSQEGYLIGMIENFRKRRISLEFKHLTDDWVRNEFLPFWNTHIPKPFIFAWDYINHPEETYLVQIAEPKLELPYQPVYRSLKLELEGKVNVF